MNNYFTNISNNWNKMINFEGNKWPGIALCVGCKSQIYDQYILRVSPDLEWHAACLKCADCHQFLDESCTCFVKDGKTYCKRDYLRYVYMNDKNKHFYRAISARVWHHYQCSETTTFIINYTKNIYNI